MKQLIVMAAMILLGVLIYQLIAGGGEGTVYSTVKDLWEDEIVVRTVSP